MGGGSWSHSTRFTLSESGWISDLFVQVQDTDYNLTLTFQSWSHSINPMLRGEVVLNLHNVGGINPTLCRGIINKNFKKYIFNIFLHIGLIYSICAIFDKGKEK